MSFELHQQLAADCVVVGDLPLCRVLLANDSHYPWFILVPRRPDISEIHQLDDTDRAQLWQESDQLSRRLQAIYTPDKLNIAALGNMVPQLHIHHIARFKTDAAWPAPVWGKHPARPYTETEALRHSGQMLTALRNSG
jgi:diadenosine tetraphosphate (Ap4A) HIT family hydrolase